MTTQHSFYLADLFVNPAELSIHTPAGQPVSLQQKPIDVLVFLAQHYPALVSRQQLIDNVWGGNVYVGEKALTNAIWQLREQFQQLGAPDCIVTVRKKGYRLDLPPRQVTDHVAGSGAEPAVQAAGWRKPGAGTLRRILFPISLVLITVLLGVLFWQLPLSRISGPLSMEPDWQLDAITQGDGRAMYPALSKDGRWLAFSWQKIDQAANLYLVDLTQSGKFKQLTFSDYDDGAMVWSPDSRYLYYSQRAPVDGVCSINRLDVVTLNSQPLASCSRHSRVYLDVSPDGRYLLFSGPHADNGSSLYRVDLQNSEAGVEAQICEQHCNARVRDLAFSPDGKQLLLTRRLHRLSEELFLRDLSSGKEQQLTHGEEDIIGISWHPDGRQVVYGAIHHGRRQGFILELDTKVVTNLGLSDFGGQSQISAEGLLYFHSKSNTQQLAYLPMAADLASALFPLTVSDHRFEHPHYNNNRNNLVYISNESGFSELWMADPHMQNRRQLTFLRSQLKYPRWSHSGEQVVFVARFPGEDHDTLTVLDVETGRLTTLSTEMRWHARPGWWYDDSAVFFSSNRNLYRFDLADGAVQQLTFQGGNFAQMWTAERLLFTKGRNRGLWQLSVDGTEQQLLNGDDFTSSYAWSADSSGLYFLQQRAEQLVLRHLDWQSGTVSDRIQLSAEQVSEHNTLSYAPALQRLYLEIDQQPRVDIMALRHSRLQTN